MAALRHGIRTVIIPAENRRDLQEIDPVVRNSLNFVAAENMETVLSTALNIQSESLPSLLPELPVDVKHKSRETTIRQ